MSRLRPAPQSRAPVDDARAPLLAFARALARAQFMADYPELAEIARGDGELIEGAKP